MVFVFVVLFDVFGALLDAACLIVFVFGGVSVDGAGVLVDAVVQLVEDFTAVLSRPH